MDETIEQEDICQACNQTIWDSSNSIIMLLNGKELARMHFDCYVKGCLWAAQQAYKEPLDSYPQESNIYNIKEETTNYWSWDYDSSLNELKPVQSEYIFIEEDLNCINRKKN